MNYLDLLPIELLHVIAHDSEPAYLAIITAYPRFAREVTPGRRVDYMVGFGHDVRASYYKNKRLGYVIQKIIWYRNNIIHRLDGPAVINASGTREWYRNGKLHREDGPAIIYHQGRKCWYRRGKLHRDDGPAVVDDQGRKCWYRNDQLHRDDGPAIINADGTEWWYRNGIPYDSECFKRQ